MFLVVLYKFSEAIAEAFRELAADSGVTVRDMRNEEPLSLYIYIYIYIDMYMYTWLKPFWFESWEKGQG